jgi:hypothetical protein
MPLNNAAENIILFLKILWSRKIEEAGAEDRRHG